MHSYAYIYIYIYLYMHISLKSLGYFHKLPALKCKLNPTKDGPLASLSVHWALKGATIHNVVTALCIAPSMHTSLSLMHRCEAALSGFLCLDIFKMLADRLTIEMKMPKGSAFMAGQTCHNLQGAALAIVTICVSKPADWCPWRFGTGRLTELAVEQLFGNLRCQSNNAQLTARGYFHASARYLMKMGDLLSRMKAPPPAREPCLTDAEFLDFFAGFRGVDHLLGSVIL